MASYMTVDLREEINRRCGGEGSRTAIECLCERRRDIEGHNLEKDFNLHALVHGGLVAHAPLPPKSLGVPGGCMARAPHLRMVVWPHKFWPHLPEKYDGTVNPIEFLQICSTSILAAGGNEAIMSNYFSVLAHESPRRDPRLLIRAVLPVHGQLRECLRSAGQ
jgi:hypothetical protein